MFTGIIHANGRIRKFIKTKQKNVLEVVAEKDFLRGLKLGESIAVDGVCLSITAFGKNWFKSELMPVTIKRTRFKTTTIGGLVNLERSLLVGDRLEGHFVLGHADGTGKVKKIVRKGETKILTILAPRELMLYLAIRGSVALNGVSMTIAERTKNDFTVSITRITQEKTNLKNLCIGDLVNIEVDCLARYLHNIHYET